MEIRNRIHIYSLLVMYRKLRNRSERKTNEIENVMFHNEIWYYNLLLLIRLVAYMIYDSGSEYEIFIIYLSLARSAQAGIYCIICSFLV